ncbi:MAG: PQQ-binding-like beta-propeller repeat protein [Deltaproteobacteria bacterium]|jgi:outer membrane protein assembly factor BamB|nr:PQQ-binding-like beta-propeller repeat protein [Deltaproteobacteria bacterium]MBW2537582.1 PQQ-binding-like beta-propeller repeat protein [Deltaproteobacteria bacterium]
MSVFLRREITVAARKVDEPYERGRPEIDAPHRRVFVGSSDHGLYALNAVNGATLWRFETAGAVQSEPLYDSQRDVVYFGSNDGALYCVRAADGQLEWRFATNAEVTRRPVLHRGTLFATNANDTLLAIDPDTGVMRWYRHRTPAFGMEISGYAGPAVHGDTVYTAFSDGVVMAYRVSDGSQRWLPVDLTSEAEQTRAGEELRYMDVDTTPIVAAVGEETLVFVASYEGGVVALDAGTGVKVWGNEGATGVTELTLWEGPARPHRATAAPGPAGPGAAGRHRVLVASSGLSGLWGIEPKDGRELWRRDLPAGGISAAEPVAGAVMVGTTRYGVFLISPLDGGVLDGLHSGGSFAASPGAYGTRAYILSNEGQLLGLKVQPPTPSAG